MLSLDVAFSKKKALYVKELFVVFRRILGLVTSLHQLNFLRKKPLLAPVGFENALGFRSVTLQWLAASARVIGLGLPKKYDSFPAVVSAGGFTTIMKGSFLIWEFTVPKFGV